MSLQEFINSSLGIRLAMGIGRFIPPSLGYRLAAFAADRISGNRNRDMVKAVRANQWVVGGGHLPAHILDQRTRRTFRNVAKSIYTFYHTLGNTAAMQALVEPNPVLDDLIAHSHKMDHPLLLVGVHLGNFDMLLQSSGWQVEQTVGWQGLKAVVLGWHQPVSGYRVQNEVRSRSGLQIYPASLDSIRLAEKYLKEGGAVITACDRPVPESKYRPTFFGRPASLNVLYVQLAIKYGAPVMALGSTVLPNGQCRLFFSDPIYMKSYSDRHTELIRNAEMILEVAAGFIRQYPDEWAMFYPVWPEAIDQAA